MELNLWIIFILGIFTGWITKIPIFLHYYKKWQEEKLELREINKRVLELIKNGKF